MADRKRNDRRSRSPRAILKNDGITKDDSSVSDFERARAEAGELLGVDIKRCCPEDALRVDLAVVLRRAVDDAAEGMFDGQKVDLAKLVDAVNRLVSLLPQKTLPQARQDDPREKLLDELRLMRERGELAALARPIKVRLREARARVAELEVEAARSGEKAIDPQTGDIVPRSEWEGVPPMRGSDVREPPVIEGAVVKPKPASARAATPRPFTNGLSDVPQSVRDTRPQNEAWREFATDVDGIPLSRHGKYWGPV